MAYVTLKDMGSDFHRLERFDGGDFVRKGSGKGFSQNDIVDYFDTYAPVARIATIRVLIALASNHKLVIHQMDVKTAFLNGELEDEVYMQQPEGFQSLSKQVEQKEGQREVEKNHENLMEPRRSKHMRIGKTYEPDFYMYLVKGTRTAIHNSIPIVLNVESDPRTYEEAMKCQDSSFWKEAINEEIDSVMGNET
ncbi:hypothetical protein RJ639_021773 [Escallonia herrerae]|uniref:Reverse transcriptase Ty1/copia-type domain-containing protein n=1 Tax=Escallonia herrerae TaxID=1293975 RepID=A0AA88V788_9ASTE|nr:hypothetical protein RJ639_021773 [Escallonia herrerae]